MKMKGQPNRDLNPVPPSQETNHATNWANEAGNMIYSATAINRDFLNKIERLQMKLLAINITCQGHSLVKLVHF